MTIPLKRYVFIAGGTACAVWAVASTTFAILATREISTIERCLIETGTTLDSAARSTHFRLFQEDPGSLHLAGFSPQDVPADQKCPEIFFSSFLS